MSLKHPMLNVFASPMEDNSLESMEWIPIEPDSFNAGTGTQRVEITHKAIDNFAGILIVNFAQEKTTYFESGSDLIKMRDAGMLKSFGISFIPSNSRPPEIFAQLSMSSAKA